MRLAQNLSCYCVETSVSLTTFTCKGAIANVPTIVLSNGFYICRATCEFCTGFACVSLIRARSPFYFILLFFFSVFRVFIVTDRDCGSRRCYSVCAFFSLRFLLLLSMLLLHFVLFSIRCGRCSVRKLGYDVVFFSLMYCSLHIFSFFFG